MSTRHWQSLGAFICLTSAILLAPGARPPHYCPSNLAIHIFV